MRTDTRRRKLSAWVSGHCELRSRHALVLWLAVPSTLAWLVLYPGYFQADHQATIMGIVQQNPSQWHSLLWGYLAYPFIYLSGSYAIYGLAQIALFATVVGHALWKFKELGIVTRVYPMALFYALFPTFVLYNLLYSSDLCFAYVLVALTAQLVELALTHDGRLLEERGYRTRLVTLLAIACLLRKNAVTVVMVLVVALFVAYPQRRRKTLRVAFSALAIFALVDVSFARILHATPSPSQEMLSVPCAQIAKVFVDDGDIPDDIREHLEEIRSAQEWKDAYVPYLADYVKANVSLTPSFVRDWLVLGALNPRSYLFAYLQLEYPFWCFGVTSQWRGNPYTCGSHIDFGDFDYFTTSSLEQGVVVHERYLSQFGTDKSLLWQAPSQLYRLVNNWHVPVVTELVDWLLFNRALPLWAIIITFVLVRRRGGLWRTWFVVWAPAIAVVASFLAFAPIALFRYAVHLYYCLPLALLWTLREASMGSPLMGEGRCRSEHVGRYRDMQSRTGST